MDSMENIALELGTNLWHNSLIYLPRTLLEKDIRLEEDIINQFCDRLIMLDKDVGAYFVGKKSVTLKVVQKVTFLNDNLFKLLQLREQYSENASKYLFVKYSEQIKGFFILSEWFIENITDMSKITKGQLSALKQQRDAFSMHLEELKEHYIEQGQEKISCDQLKQETLSKLREKLQSKKWKPTVDEDRKTRLGRIKEEAKEHKSSILKQVFNVKFRET